MTFRISNKDFKQLCNHWQRWRRLATLTCAMWSGKCGQYIDGRGAAVEVNKVGKLFFYLWIQYIFLLATLSYYRQAIVFFIAVFMFHCI